MIVNGASKRLGRIEANEELMHQTPIYIEESVQVSTFSIAIAFERLKRKIEMASHFQFLRHFLHKPPPPIDNPIFLIGTVRSGKTSFAKWLGKNPRIMYLGYELTTEWCELAEIEIARTDNNRTVCPPYTDREVTETLCNRVRNGFAEIRTQNGGSHFTRLLDDNPHLWNKLPFVRKIFPEAALIIISRDLRNTVASMKRLWINGNKNSGKKYYFPRNPEHCWGVIPPTSSDEKEDSRIFPGGDVAVLAEFWLNTYEMIDRTIEGFTSVLFVKHREFISHPHRILAEIYKTLGVPSIRISFPKGLDGFRNERWKEILTPQEQEKLQIFIERHHHRIERLKYADTAL